MATATHCPVLIVSVGQTQPAVAGDIGKIQRIEHGRIAKAWAVFENYQAIGANADFTAVHCYAIVVISARWSLNVVFSPAKSF